MKAFYYAVTNEEGDRHEVGYKTNDGESFEVSLQNFKDLVQAMQGSRDDFEGAEYDPENN